MNLTSGAPIGRRSAVQALGAAVGATLLTRPMHVFNTPLVPGVQLYTVRDEMQQSVALTLERVATIGYREVEFAGYFGKNAAEIAQLLKANGLTAPAAHVDRDAITNGWDTVLDEAAAVGHQWVIVAWIPERDRVSAESYQRLAGEFNVAAAAAKRRGLSFAYHNHDVEFARLGDTNGHAVLLKECDPALVHFELDLFWATKAGVDCVRYIKQNRERFRLMHLKDMTADGRMTEVGSGTIPFQKIFDAASGGIQHCFVEHDDPKAPFESITTSLTALRRYSA